MAIPKHFDVQLPLLRLLEEQGEMRIRDCYGRIADHFHLTESERSALLPSGKAPVINNRVQWAKVYLVKAGLLESPRRGVVRITDLGREALKDPPDRVDLEFLMRYPGFQEFRRLSTQVPTNDKARPGASAEAGEETPDERLEAAYQELRSSLASELLESIKNATPAFFEELVVKLLVAMGYGGTLKDAGRVVGKSGDEGIDGIIKEDKLGLDQIYIQAKRWENVVSRPEIQRFVGALQGKRARKGVFVTTSSFSNEARTYAANLDASVVLIDGDELAELMIDHDVGVSSSSVYRLKKIDSDFFEEA